MKKLTNAPLKGREKIAKESTHTSQHHAPNALYALLWTPHTHTARTYIHTHTHTFPPLVLVSTVSLLQSVKQQLLVLVHRHLHHDRDSPHRHRGRLGQSLGRHPSPLVGHRRRTEMGSFHWSVPMGSNFICRTWGSNHIVSMEQTGHSPRRLPSAVTQSSSWRRTLWMKWPVCSMIDEKLSWIKWLVCSVIQKQSLCYGGWRLPQLFHASKHINIYIIGEVETPGSFWMWEYAILSNTLSLSNEDTVCWPSYIRSSKVLLPCPPPPSNFLEIQNCPPLKKKI